MKTVAVVVLGVAILACIYAVSLRKSEPTPKGGNEGCVLDNGHWDCVDTNWKP